MRSNSNILAKAENRPTGKGGKGKAVVIKGMDLKGMTMEGKPGLINYGIHDEKAENPKIVMGHTITPPGDRRSQFHYLANCGVG